VKLAKVLAVVVGVGGVAVGVVSPALAEGSFVLQNQSYDIGNGNNESQQWVDKNLDATNGWVQFDNCFVDNNDPDFDMDIAIMKEDWGPDTQVGREWIDCVKGSSQTSDRVYEGDVGADEYHFTYKGDRYNSDFGMTHITWLKVNY